MGINLSIADFFCISIIIFMIFKSRLIIPIHSSLFFMIVTVIGLSMSTFYVPFHFMVNPESNRIISDYAKLLAIFVYFILGYNLANIPNLNRMLRWYSIFGILIGIVGVVLTFLNLSNVIPFLFFGGSRYKGLMIDPNYYSVLQITAFVYISRLKGIKMQYKLIVVLIITLSVLASGSKTGMITLLCYLVFRVFENILFSKRKVSIYQLFVGVLMGFTVVITYNSFQNIILHGISTIPSLSRVFSLFTDFNDAISGSGSGREITWRVAYQVIQLSPFTGIGIGTYTSIAWDLFGFDNVAHNTFLQLSAEWGILLTCFFLLYVLFILVTAGNSLFYNVETNLILRDIIIILLIGSMAISLNNARVLWLFLGALVSSIKKNNNR